MLKFGGIVINIAFQKQNTQIVIDVNYNNKHTYTLYLMAVFIFRPITTVKPSS